MFKNQHFLSIDESGAEAVAVTIVEIKFQSFNIEPDPILFRADHPFLYFIRDKTNGIILFIGQINEL